MIQNDILKAGKISDEIHSETVADRLTNKVIAILVQKNSITSDIIQDVVEEVLLSSAYKQTAKAYILQRDHDNQTRENKSYSH